MLSLLVDCDVVLLRMWAFNQSLRYDQRMHAADIKGSIAYAKALQKSGILTVDEEQQITEGLTKVGQEWASGQVIIFQFTIPSAIHTSWNSNPL